MKLWFGKHNGEDICDVPLDYLMWLESSENTGHALRTALNFEIQRRTGNRPGQGKVVPRGTADRKPGRGRLLS